MDFRHQNMNKLYHLIKTSEIPLKVIEEIFEKAEWFERELQRGRRDFNNLKGATVCSLFYEESTRTRFSFEKAIHNLGGNVISTEAAAQFSSAHKGESLEHTIKIISGKALSHLRYADIIILRHPEKGAAEKAAKVSGVPIINAGDGSGEHPTQALLDAYTFKRLLGRLSHFSICFAGDLKFSRVIGSDAILLSQYPGIKMFFVAPKGFEIKEELKSYLRQKGVEFKETDDIKKVVCQSDIAYIVRVQKNRISDRNLLQTYQQNKDNYAVTKEVYEMSEKKGTFFCHPMPVDEKEKEIRPEVETLPRIKMFEQAGYGVVIRMAILDKIWRNLTDKK